PVPLKLTDVLEDRIFVENTEGGKKLEVSYFDMPLVDNTTRADSHLRYSILLLDSKGKTALVRIVVFPPYAYSAQDRLGNDQLIGELLHPRIVEGKTGNEKASRWPSYPRWSDSIVTKISVGLVAFLLIAFYAVRRIARGSRGR